MIRLPVPSMFSFSECIWFLNRNYDDCLHFIKPNEIRKAIEIDGKNILFSVRSDERNLLIEILKGPINEKNYSLLIEYIVEWFDLKRDLNFFYELLKKDSQLSYMSNDFVGLRLIGIPDLFEALCWSIIGQQINLTFAYRLKRRLVEKYGVSMRFEGQDYFLFPPFDVLAAAKVEDLRMMQFSEKKASYLIGVAQAFKNGEISKESLINKATLEDKQKILLNLKGVGIWTANYALMKSLKEQGSVPFGDIGLLNALKRHGIINERTETEKINHFFLNYKGWESYVVFYLWRSLSNPPIITN